MMHTRLFKPADYEIVKAWWESRGYPFVSLDCLPETALIIDDVAAGFIYITNSNIALLEFVVTNPGASGKARAQGLSVLVRDVLMYCQKSGTKLVFSFTGERALARAMDRAGLTLQEDKWFVNCRNLGGA